MEKIKIIIADDHALFADGLEQIVHSLDGFEVIAKVTDGKLLMQKLNSTVPDMILMDINMPHLNGIEATKRILLLYPSVKILFISMYHNAELIKQAKEIGAMGYVMKDITASVLKESILNTKKGIPTFLVSATNAALDNELANADPFLRNYKLSQREIDIIKLIREGNATKQIATILELSTYTVETHRKNINRKLKVQSTAELIAFAHKFQF